MGVSLLVVQADCQPREINYSVRWKQEGRLGGLRKRAEDMRKLMEGGGDKERT